MSSMAMSASSYASQEVGNYFIDEVMDQVLACGVNYGSNEYFIATELFINKQQREMFMIMPSNDRMEWLAKKHITKYDN
jgi:hypothetical protein